MPKEKRKRNAIEISTSQLKSAVNLNEAIPFREIDMSLNP